MQLGSRGYNYGDCKCTSGNFSTFCYAKFSYLFQYPPQATGMWGTREGVRCILRTVSPPLPNNRQVWVCLRFMLLVQLGSILAWT